MVDVREILTDWKTDAGSSFRSVMYFDNTVSVASQRSALATFWGAVDASLNSDISWEIEKAGRELGEVTGTLINTWAEGTSHTGTGAGSVQPIPDAAQVLFKWTTALILGGRVLKGRTNAPGLEISAMDGGNIGSAFLTNFDAYGQSLISSAVGFGVWHRPVAASGGKFAPAVSCTTWSELAVLRRRRG
jgi:hypothetical protein